MDKDPGSSAEDIRRFVIAERERCLSDREWRHRLRGYGFAVTRFGDREVLTSLTRGHQICTIQRGADFIG